MLFAICSFQAKNVLYLLMYDLGRWTATNSIGVVNGINFEVDGTQLHDAGLQGVPPSSPSVPNYTIICEPIVVPIGVVQAIKMGRVTPGEQ